MCDTLVTTDGDSGYRIFGKNSDRHPHEPQMLQFVSGDEGLAEPSHPEHRKEYDRIQYPRLQEAARKFSNPFKAIISRPAWIWGAEMGVNELGVAIGNEAVFAKRKTEKNGMLGMDILRLALHNAKNADSAVKIIVELIQMYGQGGNGSYEGTLRYHNSFLITDNEKAFVLESAARQWTVKEVPTVYAISNSYSVEAFAQEHASALYLLFTKGNSRRATTMRLLESSYGSWETMRNVLIYNRGSEVRLDHSMHSICMDAKGFVTNRTTGSMIVTYHRGVPLVWATGAPLPIYSPFIPFSMDKQSWETTPFSAIRFSYRFAKERLSLIQQILVAPEKAKTQIASLGREVEHTCQTIIYESLESEDESAIAGVTIRCLEEEQSYRHRVGEILIAFGADSPSLHEKPDSYYRCG
ncbi:carcinine hydrolase/isopenicillin-N N-acyltransferase family protein [Pleomorphochaeta sp. DL1XJH-081]|uniref:carcinine hydrolase/isopenicillin-N N-acyltransferase family protein n=1 Tax=Pleomorphochaeta sp. DL1XJH-081 TaxID=3409690 RepID=UPI003BB6855F